MSYATYEDFTQVYSINNLGRTEIESHWLVDGYMIVNELLSPCFTTPFSSNNLTAKDLNIKFAYLGVLERTRRPDDSLELRNSLMSRITNICCGNAAMITTSGDSLFSNKSTNLTAWSSTEDYKSTFDMRDFEDQRVDPDMLEDLWDADDA